MDIYLGYESALEIWRQWSEQASSKRVEPSRNASEILHLPSRGALKNCTANAAQTRELAESAPFETSRPRHVIIPSSLKTRSNGDVMLHRSSLEFPDKAFRKISDHVFLAVPEVVFIQLAETLPLPQLIALGFELCGNYSGDAGRKRLSLSTRRRLTSYARKVSAMRGVKKARRAAGYVLDGSASPMETSVAVELSLPTSLGGKGLPSPVLNKRIDLSPSASVIAGRRSLSYDLYWPESKIAIEYDSRRWHDNDSSRIQDSRKRAASAEMGISVMSITEKQYRNIAEFDEIAQTLAHLLGRRIRIRTDDYSKKRFLLRAQLQQI